jgi:hypothetical protein
MSQSRETRSADVATTTTPSTTTTTAPQSSVGGDNSLVADAMAGRVRVDGNAADWFAKGVVLQKGMKGTVVAEMQRKIGTVDDGAFGPNTERLLRAWQKKNGLAEDGTVDAADWAKLQAPVENSRKPKGDAMFEKMWESHPHNYLPDASQNTSSPDLNKELGFKEDQFANTCALRMSTMLNRMGGEFRITPDKARAAGLDKMRQGGLYLPKGKDAKTEAQDDFFIVSAKEMWTYMGHQFGKPDLEFPKQGRVYTRTEAEKFANEARSAVAGRKGMIAFDNLQLKDASGQFTGYGGSGHVDIFDGGQLSDGDFYPCQKIQIWFVV